MEEHELQDLGNARVAHRSTQRFREVPRFLLRPLNLRIWGATIAVVTLGPVLWHALPSLGEGVPSIKEYMETHQISEKLGGVMEYVPSYVRIGWGDDKDNEATDENTEKENRGSEPQENMRRFQGSQAHVDII